jgi:hypothetical protein
VCHGPRLHLLCSITGSTMPCIGLGLVRIGGLNMMMAEFGLS